MSRFLTQHTERRHPEEQRVLQHWLNQKTNIWAEALAVYEQAPDEDLQEVDVDSVMIDAFNGAVALQLSRSALWNSAVARLCSLWKPPPQQRDPSKAGNIELPKSSSIRPQLVYTQLR